jgi:hypothetical protein
VTYRVHRGDHTVTAAAFVDATANVASRSSSEECHNAVRAANQAGVGPLSKHTSMLARVPLSGDVITYLVSESSGARSAASISAAEQLGRKQS